MRKLNAPLCESVPSIDLGALVFCFLLKFTGTRCQEISRYINEVLLLILLYKADLI